MVRVADVSVLERAEGLPSLPAAAIEVLRLTEQECVALEEVVEAVGRDPGFAARLLKLANSAVFRGSQDITNLRQATMLLGLRSVRMAAISLSLVPALGSGQVLEKESFRLYWRRSVGAALAARKLAATVRRVLPDDAFLGALIMDAGFVVLASAGLAPYGPVAADARGGHPDDAREHDAVGFTHADATAFLLRKWKLPQAVVEPVLHHHDPEALDAASEHGRLARVLAVAHEVAAMLTGVDDGGAAGRSAKEKCAAWFQLEAADCERILREVGEAVPDVARLLEVDVGGADDIAAIVARAQEDLLATSISTSHELEAAKLRLTELQAKATTDALTGVANRAAFDARLAAMAAERSRSPGHRPLGVILADIDHFKRVNDTFGHLVGDEVLKVVAATLERSCRAERGSDTVFRYGGEEFAIVLDDVTRDQITTIVERLRSSVERAEVEIGKGRRIRATISLGGCHVASLANGADLRAAVEAADKNLYRAKNAGRNRAVVGNLGDGPHPPQKAGADARAKH